MFTYVSALPVLSRPFTNYLYLSPFRLICVHSAILAAMFPCCLMCTETHVMLLQQGPQNPESPPTSPAASLSSDCEVHAPAHALPTVPALEHPGSSSFVSPKKQRTDSGYAVSADPCCLYLLCCSQEMLCILKGASRRPCLP